MSGYLAWITLYLIYYNMLYLIIAIYEHISISAGQFEKSFGILYQKYPAITAYELHYGLQKNKQIRKSTKKAVRGFLGDIEIVPFDIDTANFATEIRTNLELAGKLIGAYDLLIAATAMACNLILVTSHEKEFVGVSELKIENWRSPVKPD